MNPQGALFFLLTTAIEVYAFIVLTRFILQAVRADFYNPISQMVVRLTNPVLNPLRALLPSRGNIDLASLACVLLLVALKVVVMILLSGAPLGAQAAGPIVLYAVRSLGSMIINYFFFAILVRVILSWVAPDPYHPFAAIMTQVTEPLLGPVRKVLPNLGGLDLSPLVVLLGLQFLMVLFAL
ncbi:YggT family protein [Isoalcanivorax beigongshangi]|uniref:YggT family protein n=1 Tax=Isoalcanivorax beigongshangi TaxID=3238810 RepID=A0ABV4AFS9_9GAMM